MIKNGTGPTTIDHRDYDFFKSHQFGAVVAPTFPLEYLTDAGLWMPNQDAFEPIFSNPPMQNGCTDYTQSDLPSDIELKLHNPADIEAITHANANGGGQIRDALNAAVQLNWITQYFNIQPANGMDFFDSFRFAILIGSPEKRSVSWGSPWFPSWEQAILAGQVVMPMPTQSELAQIKSNPEAFPWHNSKLAGWAQQLNYPMIANKSWQGATIGNKGIVYFPREVINVVMTIPGCAGFTGTREGIPSSSIQTIDVTILQWITSICRTLIGLQ